MTNYLVVPMIRKIAYYLILLLTITSCAQEAEDTIRLIPDGYEGAVLIIFNQEDGTPKEYEDGKRVYRIPDDGVLKTQFEPNSGIQKHQFYYVKDNGDRTEIPFIMVQGENTTMDIETEGKIYAYLEKPVGKVEKYDPKTKELLYTIQPARSFYIGYFQNVDDAFKKQMNFIFKHHK